MAKESLFRVPVLGWVLRRTGMIPVRALVCQAAAKQTLKQSAELVEHGRGVIVYPEGTLTRDPDLWPMRGKSGAVRLALADGIPLIPMAQWGTQEIMGRYQKGLSLWPLRKPVRVVIGDPVDVSDPAWTRGGAGGAQRGDHPTDERDHRAARGAARREGSGGDAGTPRRTDRRRRVVLTPKTESFRRVRASPSSAPAAGAPRSARSSPTAARRSRCGRDVAELAQEIDEAKRNSRYLPGINLPRTMAATHELSDGARRRRAGVPLGAEPVAAREPQGAAAAARRQRRQDRQPDEGRRARHRPAHEPGDPAGAALRSRPHRRGIRAQPRTRDRSGAADAPP